jgi:hypothetical protein
MHGKDRAVLLATLDLAADADDAPFAGSDVAGDVAVMALWSGSGISMATFWPSASAAVKPNSRSQAGLNITMWPRGSMMIMPSTAVSNSA